MQGYKRTGGKLLLAMGVVLLLTGCEGRVEQYGSVDTAMGTVVSQTLYVRGDREEAETETAAVMELLTRLEEQELSWRISDSEVARINALSEEVAGEKRTRGQESAVEDSMAVSVSSSMQQILQQIWQVSADSGGALDVTLGRLSRLWNLDAVAMGTAEISVPTQEQIQAALEDTGYERVRISQGMLDLLQETQELPRREQDIPQRAQELSQGTLELPPGMQLDLGAVGKGVACDRVGEYLRSRPQITGAVVAVGGSVITYGQKPDGSPWKVAIAHPRREGSYLGILSLTGEHYVSTSGDYERYVMVDGVRYHHILDPATGAPAHSGLCSVTVVCDSGLLADALSTACFVLGPEQGLALAERYGAQALLVEKDGTAHMTDGMEEMYTAAE